MARFGRSFPNINFANRGRTQPLILPFVIPAAGGGTEVFPGVGELTLTGFIPAIETPVIVEPDTGILTLAGFVPIIETPVNVQPDTGVLTLTGLEPVIETPIIVQPDTGVLTLTGLEPTIQVPVNVQPDTGVLALNGFAPIVSTGGAVEVFPGVGELVLAGFAPNISTTLVVIDKNYLMNYLGLYNFLHDISQELNQTAKFFHGRKEIMNLTNVDKGLYVYSLPFTSTGTTVFGAQINEIWTVEIIFYMLDTEDSFIDQNDQNAIQDEIATLTITEQSASRFLRLVHGNTITPGLEAAAEKLTIESFSKAHAIKDTSQMLTGTILTLSIRVPDDFDYCSLANLA